MRIIIYRMTQILIATIALAVITIALPIHSPLQVSVHAASLEQPRSNDLIYRAQIEIQTCDRKHAETDNTIGVRLNQRNNTWLNYSHKDFKRNSTFTYDLMLERVRYIEDISQIEIHKGGSDGIVLRKFVLWVNGRAIYGKDFGSSCHTLDNDSGYKRSYTVSSNQLRSHSWWQSYNQPSLPTMISRAEIVSRIEGIVGNAFKTIDTPVPVKWDGSNAVKVSRRGPQSLAVKVDLKASIKYFPDDSFDVLFDISLQCNNGRIVIESTRPRTNGLTIGDRTLGDRIKVNMNLGASSCPQFQVTNNGDVNLQWPTSASLSSGRRVKFSNNCSRPLKVAVRYQRTSGSWNSVAWWNFSANSSRYLTFANNAEVRSNNSTVYYYATTTDGSNLEWMGNNNFVVNNQTLSMRSKNLSVGSDNAYRLGLKCD